MLAMVLCQSKFGLGSMTDFSSAEYKFSASEE